MKKLLLIFAIASFFSCSDDDCSGKKEEISAKYEEMIKLYEGDENRQNILREERDRALANAC